MYGFSSPAPPTSRLLVEDLPLRDLTQSVLALVKDLHTDLSDVLTDVVPGVGPKALRVWVEDPIPVAVDMVATHSCANQAEPLKIQLVAGSEVNSRIRNWPKNTAARPVFVKSVSSLRRLSI